MSVEIRVTGKNSDNEYWLHLSGGGKSAGLNLGDPKLMICSALLMASSGKTFFQSDLTISLNDPALVALVEAVKNIAMQKTSAEATEDEFISGDYEDGYDTCVSVARVALAAYTARMEGASK